ncbi:MAG TPA: type II toxin-antitoxin system VapC family toxin [Baekduia sp.]|nr:type II toxin-antitoxin system VapC family toxin [Baekduia sp.]
MKILPDTHALLWWTEDSPRLSKRAGALLEDHTNPLLFSAAVEWEVRNKVALGKLAVADGFNFIDEAGVVMLSITHAHAATAAALPYHHRDPFDRLLIAQAQLEDAVIVTADPAFAAYDVRVAW